MNKDLKKLKKDELIEIIQELKNEQSSDKEEIQKLKDEQEFIFKRFGAKDSNDLIIITMDLDNTRHTIKSLIEENDTLKKEIEEKEKLKDEIQKLKNEQKRLIQEYKENNGVQKIKNERNAGRKSKFTDKQIEKILKDRANGTTIRNIAKFNNCSVGLVHKIINEHKGKEGK